MKFRVIRKKSSYDYKFTPSQPGSWDNQKRNNSQDRLQLLDDDGTLVFESISQTVANLETLDPGIHFLDTIAPGPFAVKLFVEQRDFWCDPHGIIRAKTLAGDAIDDNSVTATNPSRWLVHDWQKHRSSATEGMDTSVAWSAGCFVEPDSQLAAMNQLLRDRGYGPGDIIDGELIEVDA
jgi:hypothetical protein